MNPLIFEHYMPSLLSLLMAKDINIDTTSNLLVSMKEILNIDAIINIDETINRVEIPDYAVAFSPIFNTIGYSDGPSADAFLSRGGLLEELITLKPDTNIEIATFLNNLRNANISYLRLFYLCLDGRVMFNMPKEERKVLSVFQDPDNLFVKLLHEGLYYLDENNNYNTHEKTLLRKNIKIIYSNMYFISELKILHGHSIFPTLNRGKIKLCISLNIDRLFV